MLRVALERTSLNEQLEQARDLRKCLPEKPAQQSPLVSCVLPSNKAPTMLAAALLLVATGCSIEGINAAPAVNGDVVAPVFKGPIGPDPALGPVMTTTGPNKGHPCQDCIFVGVTTCCKTWERTEKLLRQLLATEDNLHIVVFDDMSEDDTKVRAEAMGLTVMLPPKLQNVGLTKQMNLMWRYGGRAAAAAGGPGTGGARG
jgi:hypothetical protein